MNSVAFCSLCGNSGMTDDPFGNEGDMMPCTCRDQAELATIPLKRVQDVIDQLQHVLADHRRRQAEHLAGLHKSAYLEGRDEGSISTFEFAIQWIARIDSGLEADLLPQRLTEADNGYEDDNDGGRAA